MFDMLQQEPNNTAATYSLNQIYAQQNITSWR